MATSSPERAEFWALFGRNPPVHRYRVGAGGVYAALCGCAHSLRDQLTPDAPGRRCKRCERIIGKRACARVKQGD